MICWQGPRDHRQRHRQLLGDVREETQLGFVDLLPAAGLQTLLLLVAAAAVLAQVVLDKPCCKGCSQQHVEHPGGHRGIPCRPEVDRKRVDGAHCSGDVVSVAYLDAVVPGLQVGEREVIARHRPLVVVVLEPAGVGVVAAVDVVERDETDSPEPLSGPERQLPVVREQGIDAAQLVAEAHVAEKNRRSVGLLLESGFLDGHQSVDAAEVEHSAPGVGKGGSVAVFDGAQPVGVAVGHHVARAGGVLLQSAVGADPQVAAAALEDAVHGALHPLDEGDRVAREADEPAACAEPQRVGRAAVDGEDVVGDGFAALVEAVDARRVAFHIVAHGPLAAVSEPDGPLVLGAEREEEVLDLQYVVEMELRAVADRGAGSFAAEHEAEDAAAHRGHPQSVGRALVEGVDVFQFVGRAERVHRAVAVGVVVQPRTFGADPEQVAPAPGEDVDRVVDQLAVAGGDLRGVVGAEPFAGMELLDAEDALALGADPERPFAVAVDGPDGFREVVGQG